MEMGWSDKANISSLQNESILKLLLESEEILSKEIVSEEKCLTKLRTSLL
jgi:hypothetical protein